MKELELTTKEAVEYLKKNVKIHDNIEISYNRIFAEGEVLNVDFSQYFGKPGFKLLVSLDESGYSTEKPGRKGSEETTLTEKTQILITVIAYSITVCIGYYSDNIITIDNFNGSTVNNYLSFMLPPLFFIIL